jgi:hypothetical protein
MSYLRVLIGKTWKYAQLTGISTYFDPQEGPEKILFGRAHPIRPLYLDAYSSSEGVKFL